jgi:hypothetical protein
MLAERGVRLGVQAIAINGDDAAFPHSGRADGSLAACQLLQEFDNLLMFRVSDLATSDDNHETKPFLFYQTKKQRIFSSASSMIGG